MRKFILLIVYVIVGFQFSNAQNIFEQCGFDKRPLTLSNGLYKEFFTNNEIVQIGTVLLNTKTNKVVAFIDEESSNSKYLSEHSSRWMSIDPLAAKYPQVSPYVFCANNPIIFIDPDGAEVKLYGDYSSVINNLQEHTPNLALSRDKTTYNLVATGTPKTPLEKELVRASSNKDNIAKIRTTNSDKVTVNTKSGPKIGQILGGAFGGSETKPDGTKVSTQYLSIKSANEIENNGGDPASTTVVHEVMEGYYSAENNTTGGAVYADDIDAYIEAHTQSEKLCPQKLLSVEYDKSAGKFVAKPAGIKVEQLPTNIEENLKSSTK